MSDVKLEKGRVVVKSGCRGGMRLGTGIRLIKKDKKCINKHETSTTNSLCPDIDVLSRSKKIVMSIIYITDN